MNSSNPTSTGNPIPNSSASQGAKRPPAQSLGPAPLTRQQVHDLLASIRLRRYRPPSNSSTPAACV